MTPETLAALHARAMDHARPWSQEVLADLLKSASVFLLAQSPSSARKYPGERERQRLSHGPVPEAPDRLRGFALGRVAAEEAELLTLAVDPSVRRRGIGTWLLSAFETEAIGRGAQMAYLEVAEDNAAALALYLAAGWEEAGRRPGYYPRPAGHPASALVLRKSFKAL